MSEQNEKTIEEIQNEILSGYSGSDRVVTAQEALATFGSETQVDHFNVGIPKLDELTTGFCFGDLVVISAPTANGKTTLCRTLTVNLAAESLPVLWFSYEETPRQFLKHFEKRSSVFYLPLQMMPRDIAWMEKRVMEGLLKYDTRFVFIDHLHYLFDMAAGSASLSLELGSLVRFLKRLAVERNLIIFLIAHMSKPKEMNQAPTMNYIRDSSFVTQEADFVLTMKRDAVENKDGTLNYQNTAKLYIEKNRRTGQLGNVALRMVDGMFVQSEVSIQDFAGGLIQSPTQVMEEFLEGRSAA